MNWLSRTGYGKDIPIKEPDRYVYKYEGNEYYCSKGL